MCTARGQVVKDNIIEKKKTYQTYEIIMIPQLLFISVIAFLNKEEDNYEAYRQQTARTVLDYTATSL